MVTQVKGFYLGGNSQEIYMKKPTFEISPETLFLSGEVLKRERELSIDWLIKIGQIDLQQLTVKQRVTCFFDDVLRVCDRFNKQKIKIGGKERELPLSAVPSELIRKFYYPLYKIRFYEKAIPDVQEDMKHLGKQPYSIEENNQLKEDANEFLIGLNEFVTLIKKAVNKDDPISQIGSISLPHKGHLASDTDGRFYIEYDGKSIENLLPMRSLGPFLLLDLLKRYPIISMRICPQCDLLFFSVHSTKRYCSIQCTNEASEQVKKRIFESTEKIPDFDRYRQLINNKSYLRKRTKGISEVEIAKIWREENFENVEYWIDRLITNPKRKKKSSTKK